MERERKKYYIRESELKEIIREMVLMESYGPFTGNYINGQREDPMTINRLMKMGGGLLKGIGDEAGIHPNGLDPREWIDVRSQDPEGETPFEVQKAVNYLNGNAFPAYDPNTCGKCARAVCQALKAGGLNAPWGNFMRNDAKDYADILPANGWYEINTSFGGEPGDIIVILPCEDTKGGVHPNGHIAMCLGNGQWASDYKQNTPHGLRGNPPLEAVRMFRYRNRV